MTCDFCQKPMQPTMAVAALASILGRKRPTSEQADAFPWCCPDCRTLSTERLS
jgi:hypothetical protein